MSKVLELEFEEGLSLDEIKEEMLYYRKSGQVVMTVINGEKVYSDEPDLFDIFERFKLGLSKDEYSIYQKTKEEINRLERCIGSAGSIENLNYYRYYFGLASRYIKDEKRDDFFDFILNNFSSYKDIFVLATQIMLVINDSSLDVYVQINNILNVYKLCCGKDFLDYVPGVDRAIGLIKEYGKKGNLIDALFFKDSTQDYIISCKDRLEAMERKLK